MSELTSSGQTGQPPPVAGQTTQRVRPDTKAGPTAAPAGRGRALKRAPLISVLLLVLITLAACSRLGSPDGWSGGAVVGDTLYIGTRQGELLALDLTTGRTRWPPLELKGKDRTRAIYGTPFVEGDNLYLGGYDGILYGLSLEGADDIRPDLQQLALVGEFKNDEGDPIVGGPVVVGDLLLVGSSDGDLYAYDIAEPPISIEWRFPTGDKVWSTPAVADGVAYFGSLDHSVYAVSIEDDGRRVWQFPTEGGVVAPPVVSDGRVYVGSFDGNFYAIDAESGKKVWQFSDADNWYWAQAIVTDEAVYAPSLDGNLYALDAGTGDLLWFLETEGAIVGSPAIVHDMIAVPSVDGRLYVASLEDGSLISRCNIESAIRTPVVEHDGVVYFGARDDSIRALAIDSHGQIATKWAYFTDKAEGPEMWVCVGPT